MKNVLCIFCAVFAFSSCGGCSLDSESAAGDGYAFLSYNVCNLFDDVRDGTEYAEFDPEGGRWTPADYAQKLKNVGRVIAESVPGGPDFVALVEIENDKALADLAAGPLGDLGYRWGATLPTAGSAIRVGFLSRFPVKDLRGHTPPSSGFFQRAFLELSLDLDGEALTVFICHFKAKSEGDAATENSRRLAADVLVRRIGEIRSPGGQILVLGDLNENIDEYERKAGAYPTALMPASGASAGSLLPLYVSGGREEASLEGQVVFYSPWLDDPPFPGSYYYRGWETIDHTLVSAGLLDDAGLVFDSFDVIRGGFMLGASGAPKKEYSDHLPVLLRMRKQR
ncbi:MAG: endonuclease/exonuclease/phosphatase family protein [Spirochaetia bacterium]|jgi:endonuclease/exonuclease/phosphatase family metal-dependent hydrolase|nr:endonuclease/exonuclease/phosphatase family protein [Spirochaetia bacterium]